MDPFSDADLRDWFFKELDPPEEFTETGQRVLVDGDGPFGTDEMILFVNRHGMWAARLDDPEDTQADEVLIIGEGNWDVGAVEWLVEQRAGDRLRVYSQQMFLTYWAAGVDPFTLPAELLEKFREGHAGLMALGGLQAIDWWPITSIPNAGHSGLNDDSEIPYFGEVPSPGLLAVAGYSVGQKNRNSTLRRQVLRRVFESQDLERDFPVREIGVRAELLELYLQSWGKGRSVPRLRKMAQSIATFCRTQRQKREPSDLAISHWESDLAWLKTNYHTLSDRPGDWWPSTYP